MRTEKQIRFLLEHFEGLAQDEQEALWTGSYDRGSSSL